ncbi:MAG: hypothetical protein HY721_18275 [Planctomycetes bacterium]|nr:hypothetical protein [Planctomycetota bacterium]
MRTLARITLYSLCLGLLLGYLSYRIYSHPSQVRRRLDLLLERYVTRDIAVSGCEQSFLGPLRAREIVVPASPAIDERSALVLEDVTFDDAARRGAFRFRRVASASASPATVHVGAAALYLDHEVSGTSSGGVSRWNVGEILRPHPVLDLLRTGTLQVLADRVAVQVQDLRPPRGKLGWQLGLRDAELRWARAPEVTLEADLAECELWSEGQIELVWSADGGLRGRGRIEDLRAVERWLPVLGPEAQDLWDTFRPAGSWNVDVREARLPREGPASFQAILEHYDTSARLGSSGVEIRRLSGPMLLTEDGLRFGQEAAGGLARGEVLESRVALEGSVTPEGGELRLLLAPTPLEVLLAAQPVVARGGLEAILETLKLRGAVEGELKVGFRRGEGESLSGRLSFRDVECQGLPLIAGLRGWASFDGLPAPRAAGDGAPGGKTAAAKAPAGKGRITVEELPWPGLEPARGEVDLTWDAAGLQLKFYDLKVGGGPGEAGAQAAAPAEAPAGAQAGAQAGSVFASLDWSWQQGLAGVDLRCLGLRVATGLLRAKEVRGSLKLARPEAGAAEGVLDLDGAATPAGVLWPEQGELSWRGGRCLLEVRGGARRGIAVRSLRLGGEGRALRAAGDVALTGALDLVVFLCEGPAHGAVLELSDDTPPARWKDAARGSFRAFRLAGTLNATRSREIGALDPVFVAR